MNESKPKYLSEPFRINKTKENEEYIIGLWNEMTELVDQMESEFAQDSKFTTNVNKEEFMNNVKSLNKIIFPNKTALENGEELNTCVFMDDETFKAVLRGSYDSASIKIVDKGAGFVAPLHSLDVYAMPEEEKYIQGRKWFIATEEEKNEYLKKVEAFRKAIEAHGWL